MGQTEFNKGAAYCRDCITASIIGLQEGLGNDTGDPGYQALQELLELITKRYGDTCQPFRG